YYADIPADVLSQAVKVTIKTIAPDLSKSPLWTVLKFPNGNQHAVAQINETQYFDSELGAEIKPLDYAGAVVLSQVSLQVTINNMDQTFIININGTEGVDRKSTRLN